MATKSIRFPLPNLNVDDVTFECTYGKGCDGVCCKAGRPPVTDEEKQRIDDNLARFLPHLTDAARKEIEQGGYLSRRVKAGMAMMRVTKGWCVFFNQGCVLHKIGLMDGDPFLYKPAPCALFPLETDWQGRWYVRQHGFKRETLDLFCLSPRNSTKPATTTLKAEIALAVQIDRAKQQAQVGDGR